MSSTNRGYDRHKFDYYVTPIDKIVEFLNEVIKYEPNMFNDGIVLDPCAGGDENHLMSYPEALKQIGVHNVKTIDIRKDSLAEIKADYLTCELNYKPKTIITNPPFNIAEDIIKKALSDVVENGFVVMLQRLNFLGGQKRKINFWNEIGLPKYIFVHHRRMSFTDDGKTDSIEYAHYVWKKGHIPDFSLIKII